MAARKARVVQNITINIVFKSGKAKKGLSETEKAAKKTAKTTSEMGRVLGRVRRSIISVAASLLIFKVGLGAVTAAVRGLITVFKLIITSTRDFESRLLGLKALFASTIKFSQDFGTNFSISGRIAREAAIALEKEANKSIATAEQLQLALQAALTVGAGRGVRTPRELITLSRILTDAIAQLTQTPDLARQIAGEIRDIFNGVARNTSQVAKFLKANTNEFKKQLATAIRTKTVLSFFEDKLKAFASLSEELANSLKGIQESLKTTADILLRLLGGLGIIDKVQKNLKFIRDNFEDIALRFAPVIAGILTVVNEGFSKIAQKIKSPTDLENFLINLAGLFIAVRGGTADIFKNTRAFIRNLVALTVALEKLKKAQKGSLLDTKIPAQKLPPKISTEITVRAFQAPLKIPIDTTESALKRVTEALQKFTREALTEMEAKVKASFKALDDSVSSVTGRIELFVRSANRQISTLNRQLELLRLASKGVLTTAAANLSLESLNKSIDKLRDNLQSLQSAKNAVRDVLEILGATADSTDPRILKLQDLLSRLEDQSVDTAQAIEFATDAQIQNSFKLLELEDSFRAIIAKVFRLGQVANLTKNLMQALGGAILKVFSDIASKSDSVLGSIKRILGTFLILIGTALAAAATAAIAGQKIGGIFGKLIGGSTTKALVALAVAGTLIGLGKRLQGSSVGGVPGVGGGGGGEASAPPEFAFNQALLNLQQGFIDATKSLVDAASGLNSAIDSIDSLPFGEALVKGSEEKGGITSFLARDASKGSSLSASIQLGNTLLGGRG